MTKATTKAYQCGCGVWTGDVCAWTGPADEMVVVEYMPEYLRESHRAAGGSGGVYPHDGSTRVACHRECADRLILDEPEWSEVKDRLNPADYAEAVDED